MFAYSMAHRHLDTIEAGVLTVAAYDNFFPISGWEKGKPVGIEVRLIEQYAKACNLRLNLIRVKEWEGIWDLPRLGKADVAIGGIANARGREHAHTEWTMPYYYVKRSIITIKGRKGFNKVVATHGSTGEMDAKLRVGELMMGLGESKGYATEFPRLRSRKIDGIMFGDQVARGLLAADRKKTKKRDLVMRTWDILPTLVPLDGETFSFPTRLGSGVAVSLTAFMVDAAESGKLKKLCREFALEYPAHLPTNDQSRPSEFKNPLKPWKKLLRRFLLSPDYAPARAKLPAAFEDARKHLLDLSKTHSGVSPREKVALTRSDVVDSGLFANAADLVASYVSSVITGKSLDSPEVFFEKRTHCYNCDGGDNRWMEYVTYHFSKGDAPLIEYKSKMCTINSEKAMAEVRARGNNTKAMNEVYMEVGKKAVAAILEKDSGVPNVAKLLKL